MSTTGIEWCFLRFCTPASGSNTPPKIRPRIAEAKPRADLIDYTTYLYDWQRGGIPAWRDLGS